MKNLGLIIISLILAVSYNLECQPSYPSKHLSHSYEKELGRRFIKLGFSWYSLKDYDKSEFYLKKGLSLATAYKDYYWQGVAYETLGRLNYKEGNPDDALLFLRQAQAMYDRYGYLANEEGSNSAVSYYIKLIEMTNEISYNNFNSDPDAIVTAGDNNFHNNSLDKKLQDISDKYDNLIAKYSELEQNYNNLANSNDNLMQMIASLNKNIISLIEQITNLIAKLNVPQNTATTLSQQPNSNNMEPIQIFVSDRIISFNSQIGIGTVMYMDSKIKINDYEFGPFVMYGRDKQLLTTEYGLMASRITYKGDSWDVPVDVNIGFNNKGFSFADASISVRYFFRNFVGIYAKVGYNLSDIIVSSTSQNIQYSVVHLGLYFSY